MRRVLGRAVRNRHRHAIEQVSRRWRGGRRDDSARTRRQILISTQAGTFTINKEDHTVGNLLRMQLLRDGDTRFAGYQLPHPLEHVCHVKVETAPGRAPVEVMGGAVTDLRQEVELLDRGFRDECARAREEADARPMAALERNLLIMPPVAGEGARGRDLASEMPPAGAAGRSRMGRPTPPPPAARRSWAS